MDKFKAYRIFNEAGKTAARFTQMGVDELSAGEVVIRCAFSSVNYKDALAATGAGKILRRFPLVGGIDVAGTVASSKDRRFREGDKVLVTGYDFGVNHDGGYAQLARVPAAWVVALPQGLTQYAAMALGTAGITAALAISRMEENGLRPADGPVAVSGASGGVGSLAVDMLAKRGYKVTAITGKDHEHEFLRRLGAADVISRHKLEMGKRPLEKAFWAGAVDTVGGETLAWLTRTMNPRGSISACGNAGGIELDTTVLPFILRGVNLLGIDSVAIPMENRALLWGRLASDMRPPHLDEIAHAVQFSDLPQVFEAMLKGAARGRTVVDIGS